MIEKLRNNNADWRIYIIIAVLFACNAAFIDDGDLYWTVIGILLFCLVLIRKKLSFDWGDLLIFAGMAGYGLIRDDAFLDSVDFGLKILVVYQIGKCLADPWKPETGMTTESDNTSVDWTAFVVIVLSLAFYCRALLNYSYVIVDKAVLTDLEWPKWDWTIPAWGSKTGGMGHTHHQFYLIMMASMLIYYILVIKCKRSIKLAITGIILALSAATLGTLTAGHLGLVCSLAATIVAVILLVTENKLYRSIKIWT